MTGEPFSDRGEGGMTKILLDEAPDTRDVVEVLRLAIAFPQPREDADDLAIALRAENCIGGHEARAVETRESREIALDHCGGEIARDVAPCILEQRDKIVARRSDYGVLEIEQTAGGDAAPLGQDEEIVDVAVAQHESRRPARPHLPDPPPTPKTPFPHIAENW